MKNRGISISVESILVMVLLVIFAASMSILIVRGSESYGRLLTNKEQEENARIALSYVNMMVRQNDRVDGVLYLEDVVEGIDAIYVQHRETSYGTYIFYNDGYLWSCYTDTIPTMNLSDEVVPLDAFEYSMEDDMITLVAGYLEDETVNEMVRYISIRAGGMRGTYE